MWWLEPRLFTVILLLVVSNQLIETKWHIYASWNKINVDTNNGLCMIGTKPICLTNADILNLKNKFQGNFIQIQQFSYRKINLKLSGLCGGALTGDRRIPRPKGQYRAKCFHLMTSSWYSNWWAFCLALNVQNHYFTPTGYVFSQDICMTTMPEPEEPRILQDDWAKYTSLSTSRKFVNLNYKRVLCSRLYLQPVSLY